MLRTAQSLPLEGLSTLGFDPTRFQTGPPACYRASWQLPGPDSNRQATTSLRQKITYTRRPPICWAHERPGLNDHAIIGESFQHDERVSAAAVRTPPAG
jgi:hypothetical protein